MSSNNNIYYHHHPSTSSTNHLGAPVINFGHTNPNCSSIINQHSSTPPTIDWSQVFSINATINHTSGAISTHQEPQPLSLSSSAPICALSTLSGRSAAAAAGSDHWIYPQINIPFLQLSQAQHESGAVAVANVVVDFSSSAGSNQYHILTNSTINSSSQSVSAELAAIESIHDDSNISHTVEINTLVDTSDGGGDPHYIPRADLRNVVIIPPRPHNKLDEVQPKPKATRKRKAKTKKAELTSKQLESVNSVIVAAPAPPQISIAEANIVVPAPTSPKDKVKGVRQKLACPICHKIFSSSGSLKRHEISHSGDPKPYVCDICNRRFTQASTLTTHKKEIHEGFRDRFECPLCPQKFTRSSGLSVHVKNLHQSSRSAEGDGRRFIRRRVMLDPLRQPLEKWLAKECPVCLKTFKKARYCLRHMAVHSEERPFQCPHCEKSCYREDDLKRHIESHFDVRLFESKYCKQRFRRKRNMLHHEKTHEESGLCYNYSSRKVKQCKVCLVTFGTPFLLKRHFMEMHHRDFSVPVPRLEINPLELNLEDSSATSAANNISDHALSLCNTCGNCFTKSDYRLHRVLCDKTILDRIRQERTEPCRAEEAKCVPKKAKRRKLTSVVDPDDSLMPTWSYDDLGYAESENQSFEPLDMKPSMSELTLTAVEGSTTCKLCFQRIPISQLLSHIQEQHNKCVKVRVNKTLFKPLLSTELRSLCEVKAHHDTFNIPWFMCAKCGRTFSVKTRAKFHKMHNCVNKHKYSVVMRESTKSKSKSKKNETPLVEANTGTGLLDRRVGTAREEHWTENWAEDIVIDDSRLKCDEIKLDDNTGKPQCLICKKLFKDDAGARAHMIVHGEKKWFCEHCGETFVWKELYKAHLRKHTGEKPLPCRICGKPFREPVGRFTHEKTHLSLEEKLQAKALRNEKTTAQAAQVAKPKKKQKDREPSLCSLCSLSFTTKSGLQRHMIVMHPVDGVKPKFFDCKLCKKSYSLVTSMKIHLRKEHVASLPEALLLQKEDTVRVGNDTLSIENYFTRKNKELKRIVIAEDAEVAEDADNSKLVASNLTLNEESVIS